MIPSIKSSFILLLSTLFMTGCFEATYTRQPWAEKSQEQAKAECEYKVDKLEIQNGEGAVFGSSVMRSCMESKGWKED